MQFGTVLKPDNRIIKDPEVGKDGYIYNSDHFFRYMGAIELRNSGQPVKQIAKILLSFDTEDIKEKILGIGPDGDHINNIDKENPKKIGSYSPAFRGN